MSVTITISPPQSLDDAGQLSRVKGRVMEQKKTTEKGGWIPDSSLRATDVAARRVVRLTLQRRATDVAARRVVRLTLQRRATESRVVAESRIVASCVPGCKISQKGCSSSRCV